MQLLKQMNNDINHNNNNNQACLISVVIIIIIVDVVIIIVVVIVVIVIIISLLLLLLLLCPLVYYFAKPLAYLLQVCFHQLLRVGLNLFLDTDKEFWKRSRERLGVVERSHMVECRGGPSPLFCDGYDLAVAVH